MNKIKKTFVRIGINRIMHAFNTNKKHVDLTDEQSSIIAIWKSAIDDTTTHLYTVVDDMNLTHYEIHNKNELYYITLTSDYKYAVMELFMEKNSVPLHYVVNLPTNVSDRLSKSFKTEMEYRSNYLKDYFKKIKMENLK
jgi:hypothetical protein